MQPTPLNPAVSLESLLAHADWVRALARRLVADPNTAQDLEQEVWRTALENPPRENSNPRGWLASVARNAARSLGRSSTRREQRERASARPEALPPTSELVAEAELARELAGEVLALEEPYRTVLLLRFWRSMTPEEIARSQSIPLESVRTQLKRGLERLRERLDRRFGDREKWLAALAPLARETTLPLTSAAAGGALALLLKCGAAAALAAGVWWAWPPRVEPAGGESRSAEAPTATDAKLELADNAPPVRKPAEPAAVNVGSTVGTRASAPLLVGTAIDLEGKPVAGLELEWHGRHGLNWPHWEGQELRLRTRAVHLPANILERVRHDPAEVEKLIARVGDEPGFREVLLGLPEPRSSARTQADGRFEYSLGEGEWDLVLLDPHRTVVAEASSPRRPDWTLVVAACVDVAGTLVEETGVPIAGADVSFATSLRSLAGFPGSAEKFDTNQLHATSGADGSFALERVPLVPGHMLEFLAPGFEPGQAVVPAGGSSSLRVTLKRRREEQRPTLAGLVLDAQGLAAPGAYVQLGQDSAMTDDQGRFEFELTTGRKGTPLTATKRGVQPAVLADFGADRPISHSDILLRLGPPALSITGRVLRIDGTPPKKGHVQVADGTPCGSNGCYIEDATEGHYQPGVEVKADGSFALGGLSARSYHLLAWDESEGQLVYSEPITAGAKDVLLQPRAEDFHERLAGRVLTRRGESVEGAEVELWMNIFRSPGSGYAKTFGKVTTDTEGRFTLVHVPRTWSAISFHGEGLRYESVPVPKSASVPFTITVNLEVRTTIEVADEKIDSLQFLDLAGEVVSAMVQWPGVDSQQDAVVRRNGAFPVFKISEDAVTAVLRQGKTEVRRVPVEIRREKLLTLRF